MYLVTNHHAPIIDRDTFNRVQQELARRSSKRKVSDKTTTEQGKYSSKYALSELFDMWQLRYAVSAMYMDGWR